MDNTQLQIQIDELKREIQNMKSSATFPLEIENALIARGFYNVGEKELEVQYTGGVGGNVFLEKYRTVKYRNRNEYELFANGLKNYTVNTTSNVCNLVNNGFADGQYLAFRTTDTIPAGLDDLAETYWVINATADTFQATTDGVNPVDITSNGVGEQYVFVY